MAEEIAREASHAAGLCLQLTDFAPKWILIQTITFFISNALAVFDTYSDWLVLLNFENIGLNNPLIPNDSNWLRAWYLFTVIGTVLTVISFFHDGLNLLYPMLVSCNIHCCKPCRKKKNTQLSMNLLEASDIMETNDEKDPTKGEKIADPCKCCYRWGCNVVTRNENLSKLHLWFQNVPLLAISILFAATQASCKAPDPISKENLSTILRHVGISALAAMLATTFRLIRSSYRLFGSVGVRVKGQYCCKRLLPKKMNAVYPPDTRCQLLVFPYYCGLILQYVVVNLMGFGAFFILIYFLSDVVIPSSNTSFSLGIYREDLESIPEFGLDDKDVHLFNISGNLIPPNGPYIYLEQLNTDFYFGDIYCLSEFEYRPSDSQIYYNTAQLRVVTSSGSFCNASYQKVIGAENYDYCNLYYTISDVSLYYGSGVPGSTSYYRFDTSCILYTNSIFFKPVPHVDFNLTPDQYINTTGFPKHGEDLLVYYPPPINYHFPVKQIIQSNYETISHYNTTSGENITCAMYFWYNEGIGQIVYSYSDVSNLTDPSCICIPPSYTTTNCILLLLHQHLRYAYIDSQTQRIVELNSCYTMPRDVLMPYYIPFDLLKDYFPPCPCSYTK